MLAAQHSQLAFSLPSYGDKIFNNMAYRSKQKRSYSNE